MSNSATKLEFVNTSQRILQASQTLLTSAWSQGSASANTYYSVTGLSGSITPSNVSSKILIMGYVSVGVAATGATASAFCKLQIDGSDCVLGSDGGTTLGNLFYDQRIEGNASDSGLESLPILYLHTPNTTSSVSIQVWVASTVGSTTLYVNQGGGDPNTARGIRSSSSLILMELL